MKIKSILGKPLPVLILRIARFSAIVLSAVYGSIYLVRQILHALSIPKVSQQEDFLLFEAILLAAAILAIRLTSQPYERPPIGQILSGSKSTCLNMAKGFLVITAVNVFALILSMHLGWYRYRGYNSHFSYLNVCLYTLLVAIAEELIFRGVLLSAIQQHYGTKIALLSSTVIFAFGHLINKDYTVTDVMLVALPLGALYSLGYIASQKLSLSIGMHWGNNLGVTAFYGSEFADPLYWTSYYPVCVEALCAILVLLPIFVIYRNMDKSKWLLPDPAARGGRRTTAQ